MLGRTGALRCSAVLLSTPHVQVVFLGIHQSFPLKRKIIHAFKFSFGFTVVFLISSVTK